MKTTFVISAQAKALLWHRVQPGHSLEDTTVRRHDGFYDVSLSIEVAQRFTKLRFAGESDDDLMIRVLSTANTKLH